MKSVLKLRPAFIAAALPAFLLSTVFAPFHPVTAQSRSRLVTAPQRDLGATPVFPAGTQVLPDSTVLILEMITRLDSGQSRMSDRFQAAVATPVMDTNGRTLIPQGAIVEGRVTNVQPAKWRSRSGIIGIAFDTILLDGRRIPIRGFLTPADDRTRRQIDPEGNLKGDGSGKRNFLFIGGGAGGGAAIGAITGAGVLAATGIGAAAGITAALLIKGKEAVVQPGQRFGLQLTGPLRVGSPWSTGRGTSFLTPRVRSGSSSLFPRGSIPDSFSGGRTPSRTGVSQGPDQNDPNAIRTTAGGVPVIDVRAERSSDGYLAVQIVSETPTTGWRIYTHHQLLNNSTLEVRLRGWPSSSYGFRQADRPVAPTIIVPDRGNLISRVVVQGSNGSRTVAINASGLSSTEPFRQTEPYRPGVRQNDGASVPSAPSDGSGITIPATPLPGSPSITGTQNQPTGGGASIAQMASRTANDLENFRENLTAALGLYRNRNGSYDTLGTRRPTVNETQLVESVGFLIQSAREIANNPNNAQVRRTSATRLRDDFQVANQLWTRVQLSSELNSRWRVLQQGIQNLYNNAYR